MTCSQLETSFFLSPSVRVHPRRVLDSFVEAPDFTLKTLSDPCDLRAFGLVAADTAFRHVFTPLDLFRFAPALFVVQHG